MPHSSCETSVLASYNNLGDYHGKENYFLKWRLVDHHSVVKITHFLPLRSTNSNMTGTYAHTHQPCHFPVLAWPLQGPRLSKVPVKGKRNYTFRILFSENPSLVKELKKKYVLWWKPTKNELKENDSFLKFETNMCKNSPYSSSRKNRVLQKIEDVL